MRRDRYLKHLAAVPMFQALSQKELTLVGRLAEDLKVEPGEALVHEGRREGEFYLIVEGRAKVTRKGKTVATLGPGDYFGELAVLDPGPRNATVTAETPMEVLELGRREFASLLSDVPTVSRKLLVGMARRLHECDGRPVR
jgi:CRP/FNR family transcriptional regulator, cyclic AMP receptor protein